MKTLQIFVAALIAFAVASCSSKPQLTHMPAKADGDSNWGLIDANGEFLISDEFDSRPSAVINGIFYVEENDGLTVFYADKRLRQVGDLCELRGCGYFNDGLMPIVRKGEHIAFVDGDGKNQFTLKEHDGVAITAAMEMFINGRCAFMTEEQKWGAIDTKGNVVVEPLYSTQPVFIEDVAIVRYADKEGAAIIDRNGAVVKEFSEGMYLSTFVNGYAAVRMGENDDEDARYVMIDTKGEMIKLPNAVKGIETWNDKYIVFENSEGDCGLMNFEGETLIRAKYDGLELLPNGQILGRRDDKFMYVTVEGDTERVFYAIASAVRYPILFSQIFDYKFELVSEDDDVMYLRNYAGEKVGKMLGKFRNKVEIENVYSDYYDYDAVVESVIAMFDNNGLTGYPFGSTMGNYADPSKSKSWYRGDQSMSVDLECNNSYFSVSSATIKSRNNVVYDATPYASYYTWEFNNDAKINSISVTLEFAYDKYREDLNTYIADALTQKYQTTVGTDANFVNNVTTNGYNSITIDLDESVISGPEIVDVVEEVAVDSVVAAAY
ncbi:MAG: WG repeat-containing protein [Muribaculaceae bacterium]|nr:WG repeat-containing protein [Muribaculaceae bacterium]